MTDDFLSPVKAKLLADDLLKVYLTKISDDNEHHERSVLHAASILLWSKISICGKEQRKFDETYMNLARDCILKSHIEGSANDHNEREFLDLRGAMIVNNIDWADCCCLSATTLFVQVSFAKAALDLTMFLFAGWIEVTNQSLIAAVVSDASKMEDKKTIQESAKLIMNLLEDSKFRSKYKKDKENGGIPTATMKQVSQFLTLYNELKCFILPSAESVSRETIKTSVENRAYNSMADIHKQSKRVTEKVNDLLKLLIDQILNREFEPSHDDGLSFPSRWSDLLVSLKTEIEDTDSANFEQIVKTRGPKRAGKQVQYSSRLKELLGLQYEVTEAGIIKKTSTTGIAFQNLELSSIRSILMEGHRFSGYLQPASDSVVKTPKGTQDLGPTAMMIREYVLSTVKQVFASCGAVQIDTPVFELHSVLTGKYGEDSKLIYQLQDQGGEQLSLRYDLTVPLARYCASNRIANIKRYHIAKVYRRDEPQMNRGRFREFYQCDFDIVGSSSDPMVPEAELLITFCKLLKKFSKALGPFKVSISDRKLLDAILSFADVPVAMHRPICSAIDKLDKESWETVKKEMIEKGLGEESCEKIYNIIQINGPLSNVTQLLSEKAQDLLESQPKAVEAMKDLALLAEMLSGYAENFEVNLALARGLDYYTGVIYEAKLIGSDSGSIGAGGRYDKLIGMFSGTDVPAVGVSLGIERIFRLISLKCGLLDCDTRGAKKSLLSSFGGSVVDIFLCSTLPMTERIKMADFLRNLGFIVEFSTKLKINLGKQIATATEKNCTAAVIYCQDEMAESCIKIKLFNYENNSSESEQITIKFDAFNDVFGTRIKEIVPMGMKLAKALESSGVLG